MDSSVFLNLRRKIYNLRRKLVKSRRNLINLRRSLMNRAERKQLFYRAKTCFISIENHFCLMPENTIYGKFGLRWYNNCCLLDIGIV